MSARGSADLCCRAHAFRAPWSVGRQALGLLFGLSDTILGLTVLAWGNSLGGALKRTKFRTLELCTSGSRQGGPLRSSNPRSCRQPDARAQRLPANGRQRLLRQPPPQYVHPPVPPYPNRTLIRTPPSPCPHPHPTLTLPSSAPLAHPHPALIRTLLLSAPRSYLADILLGLGVGFTLKIATDGGFVALEPTDQMYAAFAGLFLSLLFSLLYVTQSLRWIWLRLCALVGKPRDPPAQWTFTAGAIYGVILIVFYVCYLAVNITLEFV